MRVPFANALGITIIELAEQRAVLQLPYAAAHMNAGGVLNGGASASLLNIAGTLAAWTDIDFDQQPYLNCVDLSVQYLAAAMQEDVLAHARVLRRGRDIFFVEVALQTTTGKGICQGLMIYRAPDYRQHVPRLRAKPQLLPAPALLTPPDNRWQFRGYIQKLAITPLHQQAGEVRLHMPCTPLHTDEQGHVHSGALASIVDVAGVAASWSLVPRRQGARGSTVGMQLSYPAVTASDVVADAYVQQRCEELFFSTVHVTEAKTGQLIAMGQVSYRLLEAH